MPFNVLIAGGGPAALEAALALHRLAGERVSTTLLAPEADLTYRPLSVLAPFAAGGAPSYPLERMAADAGFTHVRGRLAAVDPAAHTITTVEGERLGYDVLLVASGARPVEPFPSATAFTGSLTDQSASWDRAGRRGRLSAPGRVRRAAGRSWPLPLYELALMLAERAYEMGAHVELHLVTPEPTPLQLFGAEASREVAALLAEAEITLHTGANADVVAPGHVRIGDATLDVERIVSMPRLEGPAIPGLPADADGFVMIDGHARVVGVPDVYAAGDCTDFLIKQGGIACQQADAAAEDIAARAGAPVSPHRSSRSCAACC